MVPGQSPIFYRTDKLRIGSEVRVNVLKVRTPSAARLQVTVMSPSNLKLCTPGRSPARFEADLDILS